MVGEIDWTSVEERVNLSSALRLSLLLLLVSTGAIFAEGDPVRVAVFEGEGVGPSSERLISALRGEEERRLKVARISAKEIQGGRLKDFDVLVHPGGSGGKQGRALAESGRKAVREFVRGGGGYLGVCAGAYLATNDYEWSLNLMDAKVVDRRHWARGKGTVNLQLSPEGTRFFRRDGKELKIYYAQGPLLARREWDDPKVPNYESLAIYASEIAKNGAPRA